MSKDKYGIWDEYEHKFIEGFETFSKACERHEKMGGEEKWYVVVEIEDNGELKSIHDLESYEA